MSFPLSSSCQVWFSSIFLSLYWIDFSDLNWCCHFIQQYICIFLDLTLSFVSIHFKVTSVFIPSSISVNHFIIIIIILRVCVRKLWTSYELWMQQSQNVLLKRYSSRIHCINHDKSMHLRSTWLVWSDMSVLSLWERRRPERNILICFPWLK